MRKGLAKILMFIIIINTIFSTGLINAFASQNKKATKNAKATEKMKLEWNKLKTLNDLLEIQDRGKDSDEVFLVWDIEKNNGTVVNTGKYTLSYFDDNKKKIDLEITKKDNKATVDFKIGGDNTANNTKKLEVYKPEEKLYKEANIANFPKNEEFGIAGEPYGNTGLYKKVSFNIPKGKGFAFKYQGKTVKFKWDDKTNFFYFVINGINQGNIYDFKLEYFNNVKPNPPTTATITEQIGVFTGIKKDTFVSNPIATGGKGKDENDPINQTGKRPIEKYPGTDPEIEISFDVPKRYKGTNGNGNWEEVSNGNGEKAIEVILNLNSYDSSKNIQVTLNNILTLNGVVNTNGYKATEGIRVDELKKDKGKISFKIKNKKNWIDNGKKEPIIIPGMIYDPVSISTISKELTTDKKYFDSLETVIPIGKVYTYIEYQIVSLGANEFYLKFKPFKWYNGYYRIFEGTTLKKWSDYEEKNKGKEEVMIPVPIQLIEQNTPETNFRIDFSFTPHTDEPNTQQILKSQVVKYRGHKSDIILGTPENLEVVEADIIRGEKVENGKRQDKLFVTFKWDVSTEEVLKILYENNGSKDFDIAYKFFESLKSTSEKENEFEDVKFKVKFNTDKSEFKIEDNDKTVTKNNKDKKLESKFVSGEVKDRVETIGGKQLKIVEAYASFEIPVSAKPAADNFQFQYPEIYFITTQGEYTIGKDATNKKSYTTGKSLHATLTLDGLLNIEVAPPENIKILENSIGKNELILAMDKLSYTTKQDVLYDYEYRLLKRYGYTLKDGAIKYNVYITQDKNLLDGMRDKDSREIDKHKNFSNELKNKIKKVDINKQIGNGTKINLKEMEVSSIITEPKPELPQEQPPQQPPLPFNENKKRKAIDELRDGNVVMFTNLKQGNDSLQQIPFSGLDENQVYYIMAETVLDLEQLPPKEQNKKEKVDPPVVTAKAQDISKYSHVVTATTVIDNKPPGENEKVPSAPTNFESQNITLNSANLLWDSVTEIQENDKKSTLEYQFIKVRGQQLPESFLKNKNSYPKIWEELNEIKNKEGFKTNGDKIQEFDGTSFKDAEKEKYVYENYNGSKRNILDKTLSPNQIYFYYIRTVRVVGDKEEAYSVWVPLSITTKNVQGPTNLKIERNLEHDKKKEIIISFDSPKIEEGAIGKEYDFQYSIKKDGEQWGKDITMPKEELKIEDNPDGKTMKVTYKIKGLDSTTLYTIRVRLYNIPLKSASIYSNEVDHRTDGDPSDNDYDQNVNSWEENFKELAEKVKKEPYWFVTDTSDITSVAFRPGYFDNILSQSKTSIIDLPEGKGGNLKEYYLPANIILKSFEQNKGFKIKFKGMEVVFSSKSISPSENDAIKLLESMRDKESIADFFVKIKANFKPVQYLIDGENNTSPVLDLSLEILATKETTAKWDSYSFEHIDALLNTAKYSTNIKESIKKMLDSKLDNLIISRQINKYVDEFRAEFGKKVGQEINNITKRIFISNRLNGNIIISNESAPGFVSKGHKLTLGEWANVPVSDYSGKKAIFTQDFGTFTFTNTKLIINGIENLANGNVISNIIIKYGLDDYFGKNGAINLKANLTRDMAIGSLARIAGNSKTRNPIEFFKSKGIIISGRNINNNISAQEAIYTTMKVYEIRTNKKIDQVKIRNYSKTAGIKGISEKYKKAIQVAFELGIYNNENLNPNGTITVKEFLEMISNLSSKIGI